MKVFLVATFCFNYSKVLYGQRKKPVADTLVYAITPVTFNSPYSDFSPVYFKDGIVFSSNRINYLGIKYASESGLPLTDIFYVERRTADKWKVVKPFDGPINTIFNDGPCTFNKDGTLMFFNRNFEEKASQSKLRIMKAEFIDGEWKAIEVLPFNNPSYSCLHPSVSASGEELYFASDMAGGSGGLDLYVSYFRNGNWSDPVNLGTKINTSKNEVFPFIHPDGTLYFSSDGHLGMGGLDLFYTNVQKDGWGQPVNLNIPFNSEGDDFGFIRDSTNREGYLSSNRKDPGNDEIYKFSLKQPVFKDCPRLKQNNYCVTLFEETTADNDTIPFIYEWLIEGQMIKGKRVKYCFNGPGSYEVKLNVIDPFLDVIYREEALYTIEIRDEVQAFITSVDTAIVGEPVYFSGNKSNLPSCSIKNYFWSFGDGGFKNREAGYHVFNQPGNYIIRLGISGNNSEAADKNKVCESCVEKLVVVIPK